MYSRIHRFLIPQLISPSSHIFEETLLNAAGVETQPMGCQFGYKSKDAGGPNLVFTIKGISEKEAEKFLAFLKESTGDANVIKVSSIWNENGNAGLPYHTFNTTHEEAFQKLYSLFQEKFLLLSKEKIDEYKEKSKNDPLVMDHKNRLEHESLIEARKRQHMQNLIGNLHEYLLPELILVDKCSIFEETLLTLAGIETRPEKCKFDVVDFDRGYLRIKGITLADAEKFFAFFRKTMEDESAEYSFVTKAKYDENDDLLEAYNFEIYVYTLLEKCVPAFKQALTSLSMEKLSAYREQCKEFPEIQKYSAKKIWDTWENTIEDFLNPLLISWYSDIFEKTLLKLAGVESEPENCWSGIYGYKGDMAIYIAGISKEEKVTFLTFLQGILSNVSMTNDPKVSGFVINIKDVLNNLLPKFKQTITELDQTSPEKLENYRELSKNQESVKFYRMKQLFDEIMKQTAELQSRNVSDYIRGELHVIFDLMLNPALKEYEEHKNHDPSSCDHAENAASTIARASDLLDKVCEEDVNHLKNNATVKSLKENLASYCPPRQSLLPRIFGVFGDSLVRISANSLTDDSEEEEIPRFRI